MFFAMPPSRGSAEAPPSVTRRPPPRTNSSRFPTPFQVRPPVMSGEDVGDPCEGNSVVFVYGSGENFGSIPETMSERSSSVSDRE
jgi:hypothetical protein